MFIISLNAGSSSLKFAVVDADSLEVVARGQMAGIGTQPRLIINNEILKNYAQNTTFREAQAMLWEWLDDSGYTANRLLGIGHRIVHGGTTFIAPTIVTDKVQDELDALRTLAPLHLPFGLGAMKVTRRLRPHLPSVACFDTAFHATQPDVATRLPLPHEYHDSGYRRYGFHGLNYEHVVRALPQISGRELPKRLLVAHLGSGASMCAIVNGRSVATSMGFSTADGLVMSTRTGSIDPGVLIALMRDKNMGPEDLEDLLYRRSGLLGLSGLTSDMQVLLGSELPNAKMAVDYYCYAAARFAGSLIVAMQGVDAVAFTGGIGENAEPVRQKIMAHLAWLNIPPSQVFVVPADEELSIARHVVNAVRSHQR